MTVQPPSSFHPVNGRDTSATETGPSTSVLSNDQKQSAKEKWDERLGALEKPLKDLIAELKTAKGADLKLVEKKIGDFEKQIHDLQQNIRKELSKDLTPGAKKDLEAKWSNQLKKMEQNFLKELPSNQRGKFDEKWNEAFKQIEKEISGKKEEGEPALAPVTDQKQAGLQGSLQEMSIEATAKMEGTSRAEAISQIRELIRKSIETLAIDEKGGAFMTLAKDASVPIALQGANLTISTTENGFSIQFGNLSPEKAMAAVDLMRQNPDEMNRFLSNLNVAELRVGDISVYQAPAAPAPFQAEEGGREGGGEREGGGGGREGGGEGGREGGEREERGR